MKCPKCSYEDSTYGDDGEVMGDKGDFFKSPVKLERDVHGWDWVDSEARIYGCPSCNELFFVTV